MFHTMKSLNLLQKWYVKNNLTAKDKNNENCSKKFQTKSIKSFLSDYSDAFILVTRDITVNGGDNTDDTFKNCAPFST